jgi:uncharacterized LabA/DUF88 family protein
MSPRLDAVVLCSGDGDFQILLHHAKAEGCRAEVISFGKSTSAKLIEEADDFIDMDKEASRYLLKFNNGAGRSPDNSEKSEPNPPSTKKIAFFKKKK